MKTLYVIILFPCASFIISKGQELYPHNEPASSVPKGVFGVQYMEKNYQDIDMLRNMFAVKLM